MSVAVHIVSMMRSRGSGEVDPSISAVLILVLVAVLVICALSDLDGKK